MADIQFMDLGNALRNVATIRGMEQQNLQLEEERQAKARRQALAPDVQAAMGGDSQALSRIAAQDPDYALKIGPVLDRLDANKQAVLKRAADFTTQAGMGVLNAPPEVRPQAYAAAVAEAQRLGIPTETWPKEWGPQTEGWLHFNVKKAIPVATWFAENERTAREQAGQPVPMTAGGGRPAGWGQPAAIPPDKLQAGQQVVGYLTSKYQLPPVAAAAIAGNLFQESGFNPAAVGDGGTAYGQGQWRLDRAEGLGKFAQAQGKPPTDPQVQIDFMMYEAQNGDQRAQQAFAMLRQAPTVEAANEALMHYFRPAGYTPNNPRGTTSFGSRVQFSQQFMPPAAGAQPTPTPAGGPIVAQGGGEQVVSGNGNAPAPNQTPPAAFSDLLTRLPQGATLLVNPKTRLPTYDAQGRVAVQFPDGSRNFVEIPKPGKGGEAGPLTGTGMDVQMMNILLNPQADPSSMNYAAAYAHMSRPRVTVDDQGRPVTIQPMDMSMFPKPTFGRGGQPTGPAPLPEGTVQQDLPGGGQVTVMPSIADKGPSQKEQADLRNMRVEADKLQTLVNDYKNEWKKATPAERARAMTGVGTPLNSAYNRLILFAKGEALFNLGVLNGPDLPLIQRTIPDPSTLRGQGATEADIDSAIQGLINQVETGIKSKEKQMQGAKGGQGGATAGQTYVGPDQKPILWKEIEDTAKARGVSPDEVIKMLGLKPFGAR